MSRFADLLHIRNSKNEQWIHREDVEAIEAELMHPLSRAEIDHQLELDRFKEQLMRASKTPLQLLQRHANHDDLLPELFEGFSKGVFKVKDQSMSSEQLEDFASGMSRFAKDKHYSSFVDDKGVKFVLEKQLGVKIKFEKVKQVVDSIVKPWLAEVRS